MPPQPAAVHRRLPGLWSHQNSINQSIDQSINQSINRPGSSSGLLTDAGAEVERAAPAVKRRLRADASPVALGLHLVWCVCGGLLRVLL